MKSNLHEGLIIMARHFRNGSRRSTTFFPQFSPVKTRRRNIGGRRRRRRRRRRRQRIGRLSPWSGRKGRKREGEINKKREKRGGRKKGGMSRGAEKTKRNCGLAAVDDLGGEGRGSRPGSGMLGPLLLLLFGYPLFSRGLLVSASQRSLPLLHSLPLCISLPFRPRWNRRRRGDAGGVGGGGGKDDKRQG